MFRVPCYDYARKEEPEALVQALQALHQSIRLPVPCSDSFISRHSTLKLVMMVVKGLEDDDLKENAGQDDDEDDDGHGIQNVSIVTMAMMMKVIMMTTMMMRRRTHWLHQQLA